MAQRVPIASNPIPATEMATRADQRGAEHTGLTTPTTTYVIIVVDSDVVNLLKFASERRTA
jgi:hypothetical protein